MVEKPMKSTEVAKLLSEFVAKTWHFCPVDENITIDSCGGWRSCKCAECIRKNARNLKI